MTNLTNMKKEELINLAKNYGLATDGSMPVLKARIKSYELDSSKEADTPEVKTPSYAINAMRPAIIKMHELGNPRAIKKDDAHMCGVSEERWNQWCLWVDDLRDTVTEYIKVVHNPKSELSAIANARGRVYAAWRTVLKAGEETKFHKNMFIREEDVVCLFGYGDTFVRTNVGTQHALTTKTFFRKQVESLVGCRMAANAVLNDKDRETLYVYQAAEKSVSTCTRRLDGYEDDKDQHVKGLREQLKDAEAEVSKVVIMLSDFGVEEPHEHQFYQEKYRVVKAIEESIKSTEKNLENAKKTVASNKDRVAQIEATLKKIDPDLHD